MKGKGKRLDLNAAQVAGSAVAAVVAAKLASKMGVYGTVLGAGVISVVATCGGSVLQHVLGSTGERVRATVRAARPRAGRARPPARPGGPPLLRVTADGAGRQGEFGGATTYGTRVRGWKRSVLAAAVVFGVAMAGITAYELMSGQDLSGGTGTTVSGVVRGGDSAHRPAGTPPPAHPQQPSDQHPERHRDEQRPPARTPGPDGDGGTGRGGDPGAPTPTPAPTGPTTTAPAPTTGPARPGTAPPSPAPTPPEDTAPPAPAPSADGPAG
ncbi:hypothetical protein [Streptomyces lavendulocolor]|uniref:hypothetical protein n=1 Tax=Streptomyces lavendulocolor TaxID=67316 RepID=UPI003C2BFF2C